jgi:phospholipid:diacylglycerol acyltransferase
MSTLRRRLTKATRVDKPDVEVKDNLPSQSWFVKLKTYLAKPRGKRRNSFIFFLGGIFGVSIALFFANQNEVISLDALLDLHLDSLIDVVPQGILKDAKEFTVR